MGKFLPIFTYHLICNPILVNPDRCISNSIIQYPVTIFRAAKAAAKQAGPQFPWHNTLMRCQSL